MNNSTQALNLPNICLTDAGEEQRTLRWFQKIYEAAMTNNFDSLSSDDTSGELGST